MKNTQHTLILEHFRKAGSITNREAIIEYSISSFTKRISELVAMGHPIKKDNKIHPVTGQRYTRYSMAEEAFNNGQC
jgi:hypothetical protein